MKRLSWDDYLYIMREDLPSLALTVASLVLVIATVVLAEWTAGLRVLFGVLAISLLVNYILTLSVFSDLFALAYTGFLSAITVLGLAARGLEGDLSGRASLFAVLDRVLSWGGKVFSGGFSEDTLIFLIALGFISWFLGFNALWNLFRVRRLWYAATPAGLALLINLFYAQENTALPVELFLLGYLFLTFLLAVETNTLNREQIWVAEGARYAPGARRHVFLSGVALVVLLMLFSFAAPPAPRSERLATFWEEELNPWKRAEDTLDRLFGGVGERTVTVADYYGGQTLSMGGPITLGETPVFRVSAPDGFRYYWRSKVFDTYVNGGWSTTSEARILSEFGTLLPESTETYALRQPVQQHIELQMAATRLVYAAPQPVFFDAGLPITYDAIYTFSDRYATVTLTRSQDLLERGDSYWATSSMSIADVGALRAAGTDYPAWVERTYLQLPSTISERTTALATSITAGQGNPYDAAHAIEAYLREAIRYNERVDFPPQGVEPVDYLLFERQEGYCNYYASAMVVLLRSQGIPARIAAGFAQGDKDPISGAYQVRESDAHTWVEVYFPGYGWIEFEPTSARAPILRVPEPAQEADLSGEASDPGVAGVPTLAPANAEPPEQSPIDPETAADSAPGPQTAGFQFRLPRWIAGGFLALMGLGAALMGIYYWVDVRRMGGLSTVSRGYARMNIYARLAGINPPRSATPIERAETMGEAAPEGRAAFYKIARLYAEEQYAPNRLFGYDGIQLRERVTAAMGVIRATLLKVGVEGYARRLLNQFRGRR